MKIAGRWTSGGRPLSADRSEAKTAESSRAIWACMFGGVCEADMLVIFHKVMTENEHICKKVVELCIGRKVNRIKYKDGQKSLKLSPDGHGIRLDVYLEDDLQTLYDIEMQTSYHKFIGKRIRYYDCVMTINSLESGEQYEDLPNSYIIFICLYDPFGEGRAVYEFTKRDKTDPALELDDGSTCILINAFGDESECSSEMREFLSVIRGNAMPKGLASEISDAVKEIKYSTSWKEEYMLYEINMYESRKEGYEEGKTAGIAEGKAAGLSEGKAIGIAKGISMGKTDLLNNLIKKFIISGKDTGEIMELLSVSEEMVSNVRESMDEFGA